MKAIYKYSLHKYFKSYSTWIIMFFSAIVIGFMIGGVFAFIFNDITKRNAATNYVKGALAAVAGVTVFFGIFSAVFSGFKAAQLFKDEVENGTLLVILSKPIKRLEIILGKWLALQTILLIYSFSSVFFLCIGVSIFDNGNKIPGVQVIGVHSLRSTIWFSAIFMFIILYVSALIFSSIGILLSTRLSSTATVGIVIAIGVYIPISGLLGMLMRKPEAGSVSFPQTNLMAFTRTVNSELQKLPNLPGDLNTLDEDVKQFEKAATDPSSSLYNYALITEDKDKYKNAWWADLDYQFKLLSAFAYEKAIPKIVIDQVTSNSNQFMLTPSNIHIKKKVDAQNVYQNIKDFENSFFKVQDRLAKMATYNLFLEIQPISATDLQNFVLKNPQILASVNTGGSIQDFVSDFQSDLSINQIMSNIQKHQDLFKDFEQVQTKFIEYIMDSTSRKGVDSETSLSDDFKFKVSTSDLNILEDNIAKYKTYIANKNITSSDEFARLLALFEKEKNSPDYEGVSADERYVDISLLKTVLDTIYVKSNDSTVNGQKKAFPVQDVLSARVENSLDKTYDETWIRRKFINLPLVQDLHENLSQTASTDLLKHVKSFESSITAIANPLSTLTLNNGGFSSRLTEDTVVKTVSEIRVAVDPGYNDKAPFDPQKRADDVVSNLSERDSQSACYAVSAAIADKAVTYTSTPYANKNWVLVTYVCIAIGLIPISYFVIRKQDFR